jgi:hypothetical protein
VVTDVSSGLVRESTSELGQLFLPVYDYQFFGCDL